MGFFCFLFFLNKLPAHLDSCNLWHPWGWPLSLSYLRTVTLTAHWENNLPALLTLVLFDMFSRAFLCEICPPLHFLAASGTFHLLESPSKLNVPSWLKVSSAFFLPPPQLFSKLSWMYFFLAGIWLLLTPSIIYLTGGFLFCNHQWFYRNHSSALVYLEHISNANAVYPHRSLLTDTTDPKISIVGLLIVYQ